MKCRSSIFNFDTLQLRISFPKAVVLCLCIVMVAEFSARVMLQRDMLTQNRSLQKDIETNLARINDSKPTVWLIGNSTLEFIKTDDLNEVLGAPYIKITHGGATLNGSAAMLDYYLNNAPAKPDHVFIFITKDDLNANGMNAATSKRYLQLMTWQKYARWNYSRLRSVRGDIYQKILNIWLRLFVPFEDRAAWNQKYRTFRTPEMNPKSITRSMMQDYQFDDRGFALLADVRQRHSVKHVSVILLPISRSYVQWHNRVYPHLPYDSIRHTIALQCSQHNLNFIDLGDPLPDRYFNDYFHVNSTGSDYMRRLLANALLKKPAYIQ